MRCDILHHTPRISKAAVRDCGILKKSTTHPITRHLVITIFFQIKKRLPFKNDFTMSRAQAAINAHFKDDEESYFLQEVEKLIQNVINLLR